MYYSAAFSAVVLLAACFCFTKLYQRKNGDTAASSVFFNAGCGFFAFLLFGAFCLISRRTPGSASAFSVAVAAASVVCSGLYLLCGFRIMAEDGLSSYTLFLMTGGMLVPYLFGMIFLGEYGQSESLIFPALLPGSLILPARISGAVLMTAGVVLAAGPRKGEKKSKRFYPLCAAVFFLNGAVSVLSKVHQLPENAYRAADTISFVVISSLLKALIFIPAFLFLNKKKPVFGEKTSQKLNLVKAVPLVAICALLDAGSYFLQLTGASRLPASVLYPIVTGGTLVLTAVCGRLFFGERPGRLKTLGAAVCFVSTFFFL